MPSSVADTGWCDWRGRILKGEVNDPRAYLVGGVAAWAGLFGTAAGLARIAGRVVDLWQGGGEGAVALRTIAEGDRVTRAGGFGYGFMIPTPGKSLGGASIPPSAIGHVGYTGTSLWLDPAGRRAVILLANLRVPPEERAGFNRWRRDLHDLFWKET
jgi:CubicO group peptidase (beta-lactamase class C family)